MHKVHRITASGLAGQWQRDAGDSRNLLPRAAAQREAVLPIDPLNLLVIHPPAFPSQPHIDSRVAVAALGLGDFSNPRLDPWVVCATTLVPERVPIQAHQPTHSPLAEPKARDHPDGRCPFRLGPYQFFAVSAFSA